MKKKIPSIPFCARYARVVMMSGCEAKNVAFRPIHQFAVATAQGPTSVNVYMRENNCFYLPFFFISQFFAPNEVFGFFFFGYWSFLVDFLLCFISKWMYVWVRASELFSCSLSFSPSHCLYLAAYFFYLISRSYTPKKTQFQWNCGKNISASLCPQHSRANGNNNDFLTHCSTTPSSLFFLLLFCRVCCC